VLKLAEPSESWANKGLTAPLVRMGTIEGWFDRAPETPEDRAIREEAERMRRAFLQIDFDRPGARKTKRE
jgi:hypothetical protein